MKTTDIAKIDWFQTTKCLQSHETFQKIVEELKPILKKVVQTILFTPGNSWKIHSPNSTMSETFDAQNGSSSKGTPDKS
ncbi:hypothetical protein KIN20_002326 [Parelaphostrongylus tenuis]|uniref:Uncharacterized protein n=1 Tax=Parelaphostrongylus tenuis TaxID=148309 RepID=A0AAD5MGF5_PARTN|nr:hypothetical protein KIN20_002326 [Parelaphostrongylus tenuis]